MQRCGVGPAALLQLAALLGQSASPGFLLVLAALFRLFGASSLFRLLSSPPALLLFLGRESFCEKASLLGLPRRYSGPLARFAPIVSGPDLEHAALLLAVRILLSRGLGYALLYLQARPGGSFGIYVRFVLLLLVLVLLVLLLLVVCASCCICVSAVAAVLSLVLLLPGTLLLMPLLFLRVLFLVLLGALLLLFVPPPLFTFLARVPVFFSAMPPLLVLLFLLLFLLLVLAAGRDGRRQRMLHE